MLRLANPVTPQSFTVGHEDGSDATNKAPGSNDPAIRRQIGALAGFMARIDFVHMRPAAEAVTVRGGSLLQPIQALANSAASEYVVFLCAPDARAQPGLNHSDYSSRMLNRAVGRLANDTSAVTLAVPSGGHRSFTITCLDPPTLRRDAKGWAHGVENMTVGVARGEVAARCGGQRGELVVRLAPTE